MIRFMRYRVLTQRYIFAKGDFCGNIWLWFRGYHRHETMVGWCMMKEWKGKTNVD